MSAAAEREGGVLITGAHADSLEALRTGAADIAATPVSIVRRTRPMFAGV